MNEDTDLFVGKQCIKCGEKKPLSRFYLKSTSWDGLRSDCIDCFEADKRAAKKDLPKSVRTVPEPKKDRRSVLLRKLRRVVEAARVARSAGRWQGHDGIRAYRDLGVALDNLPEGWSE